MAWMLVFVIGMNARRRPVRRPVVDVLDRLLGKGIRIAHDRGDRSGPNVVDHMHVVTSEATTLTTMTAPERGETSPALISAAEEYLRRLPYGRAPHVWG